MSAASTTAMTVAMFVFVSAATTTAMFMFVSMVMAVPATTAAVGIFIVMMMVIVRAVHVAVSDFFQSRFAGTDHFYGKV